MPLPFGLTANGDSIAVAGALHQAAAMEVLAAEQQEQRKPTRMNRVMTWYMLVAGLLMLSLLVAAWVFEKPMPKGMLPVTLLLIGFFSLNLYLQRPRTAQPRVTSDPSVSLAEITGWMSPQGFSIVTEHGSLAATWAACDVVEIGESQIVVKYWNGEFFLFGRHIFRSDADWTRHVEWIQSARNA